jgi:hypothetical protein
MAENEEGSFVAALESAKAAARLPHSKAPASEGGC